MSLKNPYEVYQQNAVYTASPGELTLMLYNGCLKFIRLAKKAIDEKNMDQKNQNLIKAQNILHYLNGTLDSNFEVSKGMEQMYEYMIQRLIAANISNDVAVIEEIEGYVIEFRDTWKNVIELNR